MVKNFWDRISAGDIARSVRGVTTVRDWLVVDRGEKYGEKN